MANAFQASETSIMLAPADTNPSDFDTAGTIIAGEIENWSLSGGNQDIESVPVFGGFLDKEKPREQFEVSMDVYINTADATSINRWDELKFGAAWGSDGEGAPQAIAIQSTDGTVHKSFVMNNARAITWEPGQTSDDFLKGTITFKFSPTTSAGQANFKTNAKLVENMADWGTAETA